MSKIVYITGGARSGKSRFAEKMAKKFDPHVIYIATSLPIDSEMEERIRRHKSRRPSAWCTIEAYKDIGKHIREKCAGKKAVILDCLTVMITNFLMDEGLDWEKADCKRVDAVEEKVVDEIENLLQALRDKNLNGFIVSNEVGMGLVPPYRLGRIFRDMAGRVNQLVAEAADEVYFMVSGLPLKLK